MVKGLVADPNKMCQPTQKPSTAAYQGNLINIIPLYLSHHGSLKLVESVQGKIAQEQCSLLMLLFPFFSSQRTAISAQRVQVSPAGPLQSP